MKYKIKSEKEMQNIAKEFAKILCGGELILLYGNLGVGKTFFVRELAKAYGVKENVKSPTFNIMKCYKTVKEEKVKKICHIDAYRINSLNDLLDIGVEDYMDSDSIVIIEWAERVKGIDKLSKKNIKIKIDYGKKDNERDIEINQ